MRTYEDEDALGPGKEGEIKVSSALRDCFRIPSIIPLPPTAEDTNKALVLFKPSPIQAILGQIQKAQDDAMDVDP